ncbi:GDCCVxC domain-containing (seleno)protein [Enterovibrio paralichthyis]|uniref:GDCCVxC domain-containing (seleno)protein n=1 Tax=Enterovibrio paralichthyis TaxID=2853805 RepID=UPI001C47A613|nr:GDCCVxC domain-containing (seleno)protein [Enterovibrio paralichthyis]MBV7296626.1 hypothetical protein [Enterovibrio paralichthyis]
MKVILKSDITCPACGHSKTEMMPIDVPRKHYTCEKCGEMLVVPEEACCVYCTYGSVECPQSQVVRPCMEKRH